MIRVHQVSKRYKTNQVLSGVSLELPAGLNVGFLGRNGSGKSTLLRIVGGIEEPDAGYITSSGSVSWPVGLGDCGQGSLTGRENAAFVCRIQGLAGAAIGERVRFIEEFAGIGAAFDRPVRGYSSGMRSRLGFATSMAFKFDTYLFDEVLSVGDMEFRDRCAAAIEEKRRQARFIIVSHDLDTLRALCTAGVVLRQGRARYYPDIEEAIDAYTTDAPLF